MDISLFDFDIPQDKIAHHPTKNRRDSRLLCCDLQNPSQPNLTNKSFVDLPSFLKSGDLLVLNDSFVIPARIFGQKESGGKVELLLERITGENTAIIMAKSNKPIKTNTSIKLLNHQQEDSEFSCVLTNKNEQFWQAEFNSDVEKILEEIGVIPLPPYIKRLAEDEDQQRYQTVYANSDHKGSVAAPTAGLHFDKAMLKALEAKGINNVYVTLHVGAGTFKPLQSQDITQHQMHTEYYNLSAKVAEAVSTTKKNGGRVFAVGTTSLRCLESVAAKHGNLQEFSDKTNLFIYPPYDFKVVDCLITNFHTAKSSLLMLVCAFIQHKMGCSLEESIKYTESLYNQAVLDDYRFFSYGDAMLIL